MYFEGWDYCPRADVIIFWSTKNPQFCTKLWLFGVKNNPSTTPPVRDCSIRAEKLVRYVGVYSPVAVYPFSRICDSELFSHVFKSTNQPHLTTFLSRRVYLIARTPKNCPLEFICQDFQSPKLIQFRSPPQTPRIYRCSAYNSAVLKKPVFKFISFVTKSPYTVSKTHVYPPWGEMGEASYAAAECSGLLIKLDNRHHLWEYCTLLQTLHCLVIIKVAMLQIYTQRLWYRRNATCRKQHLQGTLSKVWIDPFLHEPVLVLMY
jgi:hypothetical protein